MTGPRRMRRLYARAEDRSEKASRWLVCPVCDAMRQMAPKRGRRIPECDHGETGQARFGPLGSWDGGGPAKVVILEATELLRKARWENLRDSLHRERRQPKQEKGLGWVLEEMDRLEIMAPSALFREHGGQD